MLGSSFRFLTCLSILVLASSGCLASPPSQQPSAPPAGDEAILKADHTSPAATPMPASETQVSRLALASNAFAFDLYAQFRGSDGNIFFSPYSIMTALAMTSSGARGETLADMTRVLHLPDLAELHPTVFKMTNDMLHRGQGKVELATANALWLQKDYQIRDDFLALTRTHYRAGCQQVDFRTNPESARLTINNWTQTQTHQRIRDLLQPGTVKPSTSLILTNAIYFKAKWDKEFEKACTYDAEFFLQSGQTTRKPMMHQTDQFAYAEMDKFQVLEMPYVGEDFGLVILLPNKRAKLADVEATMAENLHGWLARLSEQKVIVTVPKFEMTMAMSLKEILSRMGMSRIFSDDADFKGIDDGRDKLRIENVIHKAFVEVTEKGTEAAAATAVVAAPGASPIGYQAPPPIPEFTADRPFVYLIRDRRTENILFLGRYVGE